MKLQNEHSPRPPYRIALLITELEIGGAEKCLVELACRVSRNLFRVEVIVLAGPPQRGQLLAQLQAAEIPVRFLGLRKWHEVPFVLAKLVKLVRDFRPQILHTFLFHANFLGRIAARLAGVPYVVCGLRVADHEHPWHLILDALTASWVDRYVCVSEAVARFSVQKGLLPPGKLLVIPNAVDVGALASVPPMDLEEFFRKDVTGIGWGQHSAEMVRGAPCSAPKGANSTPPSGEPYFWLVSVGRLEVQKGFDWLLQVLAPLFHRFPSFRLIIVGEGSEAENLRKLVIREGLSDQVALVGFRNEAPRIVKSADLFLLSSRWEGMPNVLLEAMALGKPIVTTDVEGAEELLGPLRVHQLVPRGDARLYQRAVMWHHLHRDESIELGKKNQQRVRDFFSWERVALMYGELWKGLCGGHSIARLGRDAV